MCLELSKRNPPSSNTSHSLLSLKPPSSFDLHTSSQVTLAPVEVFGFPDHRKAAHIRSISSKHLAGKRNVEHQQFEILEMTRILIANDLHKIKTY